MPPAPRAALRSALLGHLRSDRPVPRRPRLEAVTRTCWLSHLHNFHAWAVAHELTDRYPTTRPTRPKLRRKLPRPLPEPHYRRALAEAPTAMLRAWLLLGGYAGLRCAEIATLTGTNVDLADATIRVVGKGAKERVVPLHDRILAEASAWPATGPVFSTVLGVPYTPAQVSSLIGRYLRSLGINATAHQLRHRFATAVLAETGDISVVADLCGHASLDTARIYAEVSAPQSRSRRTAHLTRHGENDEQYRL